jgi:hypothetical protein
MTARMWQQPRTFQTLFICYLTLLIFFPISTSHADSIKFNGRAPILPSFIGGNAWYIFADGEIDVGSDERLEQFLRANNVPQKSELFLNSPGGNLIAGIKLRKVIRAYRLHTYIGKDQNGKDAYDTAPGECYSACALTFLGGEYRFYHSGSEYGVHRFYAPANSTGDADTAQILSAMIVQYIRDMGADPKRHLYT